MRFYEACMAVAKQIKSQMSLEDQLCFMEASHKELWQYHFSLGLWVRNHCLDEKGYLYRALFLLGKQTKDEMSMFLLEFSQGYFLLERANML